MLVCSPVDSTGNLIWPCKDEYGYITTQFDDLVIIGSQQLEQ